MLIRWFMFILICANSYEVIAGAGVLIPFRNEETWGYLNERGEIVISPIFEKAQAFFQGLAVARMDGCYGYILPDGSWHIPPMYEYVERFETGGAIVYNNGLAMAIDRQNKLLVAPQYKSIKIMQGGENFLVETFDGFHGILHRSGCYILPPNDCRITPNSTNYLIHFFKPEDDPKGDVHSAILTKHGDWLVAPLEYAYIADYAQGYFLVEQDFRHQPRVVMDSLGRFVTASSSLFFNPKHKAIFPFGNNYLVYQENYQFAVMDAHGQKLTEMEFEAIFSGITAQGETNPENGLAYLNVGDTWYLVDSNGKIRTQQKFKAYGWQKVGHCLQLQAWEPDIGLRYGVWDGLNGRIINPNYEDIVTFWPSGLPQMVIKSNYWMMLDEQGNTIWKHYTANASLLLDMEYKGDGHFFVATAENTELFDGFGEKRSYLKTIPPQLVYPQQLMAFADTNATAAYNEYYKGHKVYLVNNSNETAYFYTINNQLPIKLQALNPQGKWQDIEIIDQWCGGCTYKVPLRPGKYWEFVVPTYRGSYKTKLRAKGYYYSSKSKEKIIFYSNEWEARINPTQFWRILGDVREVEF